MIFKAGLTDTFASIRHDDMLISSCARVVLVTAVAILKCVTGQRRG